MEYLWDCSEPGYPDEFWIKAAGDRLRGTQRTNPENAFDVLQMLFTEPEIEDVRLSEHNPTGVLYTFRLPDNSRVIVEATGGIGSGVEVL